MAKTFKNLQDECLQWMADEGDTGLMLDLVKQALDKCQRKLLNAEQFDFMLSPLLTLSVVSGQTKYALPGNFLSMLYVKNDDTDEFLEEVAPKGIAEANEGLTDANQIDRFSITSLDSVIAQPASAGTVVITPSGGNEAAANGIVIQGLDSTGLWAEETLSSGSTWASLTSTTSFQHISNIIKTGATWTRTITVTRGSTTLLTLLSTEYAKQYQILELLQTPSAAATFKYRYFTQPINLVYDNQLPQVPESYRDILVWDTLLMLPGFTRATPEEMEGWVQYRTLLHLQMTQNHQQGRTLGARARRIKMVDRT